MTAITPREKGAEILRPVRKRKKSRKLGPVDVIRREDYGDLELDAKVELIRSWVRPYCRTTYRESGDFRFPWYSP